MVPRPSITWRGTREEERGGSYIFPDTGSNKMEEDARYLSPGEEHRARDNLLANQISLSCQRCLTHLHVISLHERGGGGGERGGGKKSG